jgi:hypothetical protein
MSEMADVDHGWMILEFAICVLFQLFVLDIIVVLLAKKNPKLNSFFTLRGYWYDYELENDFLINGKQELI